MKVPAVFLLYPALFSSCYCSPSAFLNSGFVFCLQFFFNNLFIFHCCLHYHSEEESSIFKPEFENAEMSFLYRRFSLLPPKWCVVQLTCCQCLPWVSYPSSLPCSFSTACWPKKRVKNALAFFCVLNTDLCFCISIYCCIILTSNLRTSYNVKKVLSYNTYGLILKSC